MTDIICKRCGAAVKAWHSKQKYCRPCGEAVNRERSKKRRAEKPKPLPRTVYCRRCGDSISAARCNRLYCDNCRKAIKREQNAEQYAAQQKNNAAPPATMPKTKARRAKPKTLSEIAAECDRLGITYGQYQARETLQRERGVKNETKSKV